MSVNRLMTEAVLAVMPVAPEAPLAAPASLMTGKPAQDVRPPVRVAPTAQVPAAISKAQGTVGNALTMLVRYVPTEVVTLYVAIVAARPQIAQVFPWFKPVWIYWGFICLTPLMFALLFYNKLAVAKQNLSSWKQYPWWKTSASTIAFAVWALAVPNSPYLQGTGESVLAGIAALFVSTVLSLFEPIFERK